ncbi:MAG: glycerate kinase [Bacillota bacterium]
MRILVAPDSFKGSLSAAQVAQALGRGLTRALPGAVVLACPVADGGEGTAEVLCLNTGGRMVRRRVAGPLGEPVDACFAVLGDGETAVVEIAAASGLPLVPPDRRDPMVTTSLGTGELIMAAIGEGCRRVMVALGGSATVDGGLGMLEALGFRHLDAAGQPVPRGGRGLARVATARRPDGVAAQRPDEPGGPQPQGMPSSRPGSAVEFLAACDVDNPLVGEHGAARVYGPQKGATPGMVEELDRGLAHLAGVWKRDWGVDVAGLAGAGAAGGAGAALAAALGAPLLPGARLVIQYSGLEELLPDADLVVTGEGRMDSQTRRGKAPATVAAAAGRAGVPVVAVCGSLAASPEQLAEMGIAAALSIAEGPLSPEESMARAAELLERTGERLGTLLRLGGTLAHRLTGPAR